MNGSTRRAAGFGAWYTVGVLSLLYAVSIVDRLIMPMAVVDMRRSLGISDFQVSLMMGFAFALFYTTCGLPIGAAVDRYPQRWVIFIGIVLWSLAAAACGLARNGTQLFAARMGVGAGEAAISPASYSIMSALFAKDRLAGPISLYTMGGTLGGAFAVLIGGLLLQFFSAHGGLTIWYFGPLQPWQSLFVVTGLPGVVIALLIFTVSEPSRAAVQRQQPPFDRKFTDFVKCEWQLLTLLLCGFGAAAMLPYGLAAWIPSLLRRSYGIQPAEIGRTYGLIVALCGIAAHSTNGFAVDWLFRRGLKAAHLWFFIVSAAVAAPIVAVAFLSGAYRYALVGIIVAHLILTPFVGYAAAAVQLITPAGMNGRMSAVFLFVISVFGLGLGPSVVAALTDFVFHSDAMLGRSLAVFVAVAATCAAVLLAAARGRYLAAVERARL
jgi:MFS family permease